LDKAKGADRNPGWDEIAALKIVQEGKTEAEQYRLSAAACALIKCADGIHENDPNYQALLTLQQSGEEFKDEQQKLRTVASTIYLDSITDEFGNIDEGGAIHSPYIYTLTDTLLDLSSQNQVGTRALGLITYVSGSVESFAGGAACTTGIGCAAGALMFVQGTDYSGTGYNAMINGEMNPTFGAQTLTALGIPENYSELIYAGLGIGATAGVLANTAKSVNGIGSGVRVSGAGEGITVKNVDELIQNAGTLSKVKGGRQGFIEGNIDEIFSSLTKNGKQIEPNRFQLPDGTIVTKYPSSTNGVPTLQINRNGQIYKIRVQ